MGSYRLSQRVLNVRQCRSEMERLSLVCKGEKNVRGGASVSGAGRRHGGGVPGRREARRAEPPAREAGIKVSDVGELVDKLKNEAKVI